MRLERVPLHPGDELRFVVGVNLETAVAVEYVFQEPFESHRRKGLQDAGKLPARGRLARRDLEISVAGRVSIGGDGVLIERNACPDGRGASSSPTS